LDWNLFRMKIQLLAVLKNTTEDKLKEMRLVNIKEQLKKLNLI